MEEVLSCFNEPLLLRSALNEGHLPQGERVIIVDTMGELTAFYSLATVAVVGGSFYAGVEGHNPLESAALGTPTVFGPYMANFTEPAAILCNANGAKQVSCAEDLYETLSDLLSNGPELRQLGTRGRKAVLDGQGAVQRTMDAIAEVLGG